MSSRLGHLEDSKGGYKGLFPDTYWPLALSLTWCCSEPGCGVRPLVLGRCPGLRVCRAQQGRLRHFHSNFTRDRPPSPAWGCYPCVCVCCSDLCHMQLRRLWFREAFRRQWG